MLLITTQFNKSPFNNWAKFEEKHPNSLKLQRVPIEEFSQTFDYGLKDITKLDDFNQVVDWGNSSFYHAITKNLNKT